MNKKNINLKILTIIAIVFCLSLFAFQLGSPVRADEYWYFDTANNVLETGEPIVEFCTNNNSAFIFGGTSHGAHPTTYIYYLAAILSILPASLGLIRLSGLPFLVINMLLIFFISRNLFKNKKTAFIAVALYAINPLTIQGALLLDINNSILSSTLLFMGWAYTKKYKTKCKEKIGKIFGIAAVFISKFTVFPILLVGILVHSFLEKSGSLKDKVVALKQPTLFTNIILILVGAIVGFALLLLLQSITNYHGNLFELFSYFFNRTDFYSSISIGDRIITILYAGFKTNLLWITLPLTAMFALGLKDKRTRFFSILALIAFLQYLFSAPSAYRFPKYMAAFLPFIIIVAAGYLEDVVVKAKHFLWALFPGVIFALFLNDPISHAKDFFGAFYIIAINAVTLLPALIIKRRKEILLMLYIGTCVYTGVFHLTTTYTTGASTMYDYGDIGFSETIDYLNSTIPPGEYIYTQEKGLAYYSNTNKYCFTDDDGQSITDERLITEAENDCVRVIVLKKRWEEKLEPEMANIIDERFNDKKVFGEYIVYKTGFCETDGA
jgi:hypothetical protein